MIEAVAQMLRHGADPRMICEELGYKISDEASTSYVYGILQRLLMQMGKRERQARYDVDDIIELIQQSNNIIVLTGAGISVSCGIPDFRSKDGLYAKLAVDFPELPDPQVSRIFQKKNFFFLTLIFLEHVLFGFFQT